ncbi:MAG: hypothetical protein E7262_07870 [Lachnospiraceae bacterium]|nr:hypothetical protein [Lachnospiraceae bacterium]
MKGNVRINWRLVVIALLVVILLFPGSLFVQTSKAADDIDVNYKVYYKDYGWSNYSNTLDDEFEIYNKVIEAIKIEENQEDSNVLYSAYVYGQGWMPYAKCGKAVGKISRNMPIRGIKMKLSEKLANKYDIEYRVCYGKNCWTKWFSNGENSTKDFKKNIYNIEVRIVNK